MTKTQAETEIVAAQAEVKRLSDRAQNTWSAWHGGAAAEYKRAEAAISSKFTKRYQKLYTTERKKVEDAERAVSALRCKWAGTLCGYPINSVMGEWVQSWIDWKPTGRTGTLEAYRNDTE